MAISLSGGNAFAKDSSADKAGAAPSLDEQVQEIKSDVLAIAAELSNLEERLLFPSNTQLAIFVSFADETTVAIDSARIQIDGQLVAHHLYSFKEVEALERGGVQRIYTGNVRTGEHRLEVSIVGKLDNGEGFEATDQFVFSKEVDPKLVGITLGGQIGSSSTIAIAGW